LSQTPGDKHGDTLQIVMLPALNQSSDACIIPRQETQMLLNYINRGWAKRAKGDFDGAIADYSKAIELNPKLAVAYSNRGEAKKAKGDQEGADADLAQAEKLRGP
jgi:tetratricopeptide (TPR) repeat protein